MPIEQEILDYAAMANVGEAPPVDDDILEYARHGIEADNARKSYLRDKYAWGLASDFSGNRLTYLKNATEEIKDPIERQFLIGEVAKIKKAMEWIERRKYNESGFRGRFLSNAGEVGQAFAEAGVGMAEAAKDVVKYSAGYKPTQDDVEFRQAVDHANLSQDFELSGFRGVTQKAAEGMAAFAPDMSAGLAAGIGAGPIGMFSYWTARTAPEQIREYTAMGVDPSTAALAGYGTAAASAAIELFNYDPTGLASNVKRTAIGTVLKQASRVAKEGIEEPWQATTESALQYFVGKLYPGAKGPEFAEVAAAPGMAVQETLPAIIGIGMAGGGGRNMRIMEDAMIEKAVVRKSNEGTPVSRSQWKRWGFPDVETSQDQRNERVFALAERIKSRDQAQSFFSRTPPTEAQWKEWGLPEELGETPEARLSQLDAMVMAGAALEAAEIAPGAPGEAANSIADAMAAGTPASEIASRAFKKEGEVDLDSLIESEMTEVDDKNFVEDESGNIGIRMEALASSGKRSFKKAKHLAKKFFTGKGELTQEAFDLTTKRDAQFAYHKKQIAFVLSEANRALQEVYGSDVLTPKQRKLLSGYLHGEVHWEQVPEPLRGPLNKMRDQIDALTRAAIDDGIAQGELAVIFDENQGTYVTRGYRVFNEKDFELQVPEGVRNKFIALLRDWYPEKSEAQIHGLVKHILYKEGGPFSAVSSSKLGAKDLSVLKRRVLDEFPELRALYGEYDDFRVEYAQTVTKVGNLVAQHRFLTDLRAEGLKQGFFSTPEDGPTVNQFGDLKKQIAVESSKTLYPLNGMYTTPEIYDALTERSGDMPDWLKVYMLGNMLVKTAKTIWSPMTHVRNAVANVGFAVQNGHWRVGKFGVAWQGVVADFLKSATPEVEGRILRLVQLGILGEDVHAGELRDYIKDYDKYNDFEGFAYDIGNRRRRATERLVKRGVKAAHDLYMLEDAFWKIYAFENEKARYRNAIPLSQMTDEQLEERVAKIVRDTYPTYSLVAPAVKGLRRFPIVGAFVSFPAEVIRTTKNSIKLSMEEMSDPQLRTIGAQRFAGNLLALTTVPGASAISMFLSGVSRKDDEDMRKFIPHWQKNSNFIHFGKNKNGDFKVIDLGYSDPHNILRKPFKAFMRGESLEDSMWDGLSEAAEPFIGMDILAGALMEARANEHNRVRNPADDPVKQSLDTTKYIWDNAFKPGAIASIERIAKGVMGIKSRSGFAYNPWIETIALISGQRLQNIDISQSLMYRVKEFKGRKRDADNILNDVVKNRGSVSKSKIVNAYAGSEKSRQNLFEEFSEVISAARRLNVSNENVWSILQGEGVSKADLYALHNGVYIPRQFSRQFYESIYHANPDEYSSRAEALEEAMRAMQSDE